MHSSANVGLIPGRGIDPKLMDVVGYPHSVINGTAASNSKGLPESQAEKDFWQQQCRGDQAFFKGSNGETAKQMHCDSELLRVWSNCRTTEAWFQAS